MSTGLAPGDSLAHRAPAFDPSSWLGEAWPQRTSMESTATRSMMAVGRMPAEELDRMEATVRHALFHRLADSGRMAVAIEVRWYLAARGAERAPVWRDEALSAAVRAGFSWALSAPADSIVCVGEALTVPSHPSWGGR